MSAHGDNDWKNEMIKIDAKKSTGVALLFWHLAVMVARWEDHWWKWCCE